ncbi:MAG: orotidine-5'-phosphate decarboxylase [Pseudomonadota bacterium]
MKSGRDYIIFPLDVASMGEAEAWVRRLDGRVGMFKIGLELFILQGPSVITRVRDLSNAGIFLDLKLHDISATVRRAMERVAELGVDLVTVHCSSSARMLEMAVQGGQGRTGVLGVTLLTDNDAHVVEQAGYKDEFSRDPGRLVMKRAGMAFAAGCSGVVCSGREVASIKAAFGQGFLAVTPGIRPEWTVLEADDQKRITTPASAVLSGADLIVVGRPIRAAVNPESAAARIAEEIDSVLYR